MSGRRMRPNRPPRPQPSIPVTPDPRQGGLESEAPDVRSKADASGRFGRMSADGHAAADVAGEARAQIENVELDDGVLAPVAREDELLAELDELTEGGMLIPVPDDREFVVTEVVVPGLIELGFSRLRSQPCPHPAHRESDWDGDGGRRVCGVCHPQATPPPSSAGAHGGAETSSGNGGPPAAEWSP
jgi:hypothetical protein